MMLANETDLELSPDNAALSLIAKVEKFLSDRDIRAYVVGGFLRDTLLCRETDDIDIALEANALTVASDLAAHLNNKFVPLDKTNLVGRIILPQSDCAGKQWHLDLSTVEGGIVKDLGRRDFTIDAMAINIDDIIRNTDIFPVIDPFNGIDDLQHKIIRATGETVFKDDAVRLLRGVRLAAELGFKIDPKTETLIQQSSSLAATIAGERVREELLRLLELNNSGQFVIYLDKLKLIEPLIPELHLTKGVEQPKEHQWDVFNHSVKTVDAADFIIRKGKWPYAAKEVLEYVPWSAKLEKYFAEKISFGSNRRSLLKMAGLMHDIAKPQTRAINERGRVRFYHHPQEGAPITTNIMERLRFSSRETKLVTALTLHHLRPVQMNRDGEMPSRRAVYRYYRDTGDAAIDTLFFSLADHLAARGKDLDIDNWKWHTSTVDYILSQRCAGEETAAMPNLISGYDIINNFDLKAGPEVGRLLEAVREAHACGEISTKEEALAYAQKMLSPDEED